MNRKGFTLVELLTVIVIIALISGIAVIGYKVIFSQSEEDYYKNLENSLMLAGNDYFIDHRLELPVGNYTSPVDINTLVNNKYIEPVKDSNGNICTNGKVIAYNENNQFNYVACIKCGDYETDNDYCKGKISKVITISAKTKNDSGQIISYNAENSYINAPVTKHNVSVTFSMEKAQVAKFEILNETTKNTSSCDAINNSCFIEVKESGTYKVTAYDFNNKVVSTNQYINIRIEP